MEVVKPRGMGTWKARIFKKEGRGSQDEGRKKAFNCQASARSKFMAKRNRSYKDKEYSAWCQIKDGSGHKGPG